MRLGTGGTIPVGGPLPLLNDNGLRNDSDIFPCIFSFHNHHDGDNNDHDDQHNMWGGPKPVY